MSNAARVLVVDDEEVMRDSCRQVLAGEGYTVELAENGSRALQMAGADAPDLVLLDLKMPGMGGLEVLRELRALDEFVVIVVITGYATIESAVEAFKRGAYDFLPKPFIAEELRIIVRRGLERRSLQAAAAQLQEEKARMQRLFAAMVSHQLRGPLAAIQQNLEALLAKAAGGITEKQSVMLSAMRRQVGVLLRLTRDWMELSRLESVQAEAPGGKVPLRDVVGEAIEAARTGAQARRITVRSDACGDVVVSGNRDNLRQLFGNLIDNAVKYNREGGEVAVATEENGRCVEVRVRDTGTGIEPAELPFIFDEFRRGGVPGSLEGSGLGLAIARRIAMAHSGTIRAESECGKGSTFIVCLPKALLAGAKGGG